MYEMINQVPFTSCAPNGEIHLHKAIALMMDSCQFQEYQEKAFCDFLRTNGIAIFLFSIQVDILRMPRFRENVKTTVKIYGCKSIYGLRRITIRDEAGKICLISNATGAFFDIKAGKALKLSTDQLPLKFDEAEDMECLPRKIPVPQTLGIPAEPYAVTNSDLDPNGHFTAASYFAAAKDALPENFSFNRVRIEYKQQVKSGEKIYPMLFRNEADDMVVNLRSAGGLSYAAAEFSTFEKKVN